MLYAERDEEKRQKFMKKIAKISPETLVYIDEAGIDKFITRQYGWADFGKKVHGECSGKRFSRESFIAAKTNEGVIAPFCYKGTCDTELFNYWLENLLLPNVSAGSTIIMDNASIHKSQKTKFLVKKAKCYILFLPAYSPDLNPIEHLWAQLKAKIRKCIENFNTLSEAIDYAFKSII